MLPDKGKSDLWSLMPSLHQCHPNSLCLETQVRVDGMVPQGSSPPLPLFLYLLWEGRGAFFQSPRKKEKGLVQRQVKGGFGVIPGLSRAGLKMSVCPHSPAACQDQRRERIVYRN